jgi:hypothetical protein
MKTKKGRVLTHMKVSGLFQNLFSRKLGSTLALFLAFVTLSLGQPKPSTQFCFCLNGRLQILKEAQGQRPQSWRLFKQNGREIRLPGKQILADRYTQDLPNLDPGIYTVLITDSEGRVFGNSVFLGANIP